MKRHALILIVLVVSLALPALSEEVVVNDVPCFVFQQEYPAGPRLWIFKEPVIDLDGSQPGYVAQGWGTFSTCFAGMDSVSVCSAAQAFWQFALRIDGALITPDYITIYRYDPDSPLNPPSDTPDPVDEGTYVVRWVYAFPAGHFRTGIYFFEGTWTLNETPCDVCPCEEGEERSALSWSTTSTVTVTYPYDWEGSP